ncbi:1-deoxy-D-xylulose 5-phosphate reductoisomerase [Leptospirillum ferriphilum]|uniref:1-deoxy-D-xylulose 5-phosphate reductoisomerase n=1 Tax=Leptospirillum ferriphilum TaxID=178606 RepID=A0A094X6G1_9BACT|nr:1-deoxy-D-xylulose-5-phosphate reductoisomerase [Leptospirillum ferriphilum]KGA94139.1 1-deoxy-D-xylulose 5-phosphate reductoisomerase [Leptospirillum ferriphilum]
MITLSILGSTGSIGRSTLDIVRAHPERFRVLALAAGKNAGIAVEQAREFRPEMVSVANEIYPEVRDALAGSGIRVLGGLDGACAVSACADASVLLSAIVGEAGLAPTWEGILPGRVIALANKETLVAGGEAVVKRVKAKGARLMPVDSEHSAIHQAMRGHPWSRVRRVILTASGGPMFGRTRRELQSVTVEEALNHPTWKMGPKITVDSATLMNKGLEIIEAKWLFDLSPGQIEVVVHRQSIIHSMVEFVDGSFLAQLGSPDMRGPISYAISGEDRLELDVKTLDFPAIAQLTFHSPDHEAFPSIGFAFRALEKGGQASIWLNAANELAVQAFLDKKIPFDGISRIQKTLLEEAPENPALSLEEIQLSSVRARTVAGEKIEEMVLYHKVATVS